jgi:two-component system, NtrC family, sensor kinase
VKILLADDDSVFQIVLGRNLAKWGYEPVIVDNGEDAWEVLKRPNGPGMAIVDWVMPLTDGVEVCRRVRSGDLPHYVYILLLTSKVCSGDLMAGFEAGADDYLSKPVNPEELRLRLRAGRRVLEFESRHRHIAESASEAIVTLDETNRICFANCAAGSIFGYARTDLLGLRFTDLVPDFEEQFRAARSRRDRDDGDNRSPELIEIMGKHHEGRSIALEASFSEIGHNTRKRVLTAVIRDVTERRRMEFEKAQTQKLESIGQLAAGVAHEMNTPIQYIGDNLRFVLDSWNTVFPADDPDIGCSLPFEQPVDFAYLKREVPSALSQALDGVQHLAGIVRAMKEFAHPGAVEMVPADINHLIETTIQVSKNHWKYVADLKTDLDPGLPLVPCLPGELSQVFLNLLVNAADAITEALKDRPGKKGTIDVTTRASGSFAEIRISDSGTGIRADIQSKIYDPFFTTKEVGRGSGQGLTLAHATVVKKHHGSLDFETALGAGTTFVVRLPLSPQESNPISP